MYITEERILTAPNDERGRAYIDKMCEAHRLSGTAYKREDTATAISLRTLHALHTGIGDVVWWSIGNE